jgi:uncharacterized protein (TIRG00374 family)
MMWRTVLKVAVSAALITALLWRTPVGEIGASLSALDATTLAFAFLLFLAAWILSAVRLWLLAPEFSLPDVVRMTFIANYYGTVLPGQVAGDVMKAYRLSRGQGAPGESAAVTIIDRVVATFTLFLLGACTAPWIQKAPRALILAFGLGAVAILLGMLLLGHPRVAGWITGHLRGNSFRSLFGFGARLVDGMHRVLQRPGGLAGCFVGALIFHGLCIAVHVMLGRAIGIELPVADWILVYSGVSLLLVLPISFAGVGLREGGYVGLLAMYGVAATQALSLSFAMFAYALIGAMLGWLAELRGQ